MSAAESRRLLEYAFRAGGRRDYRSAVRYLEELVTRDDADPEAWLFLGRAYHALGDYGRALAAFRDYLALKPDSVFGLIFAGRAYLASGLADRAYRLLKKARRERPNDPNLLALLGTAALKCRRSAEAVACLEAAVGLDSANNRIYKAYINALTVRGFKLIRYGDRELGAQMLRFATENGPDFPLIHLELARYNKGRGDYAAALENYNRAIALEPDEARFRWYRAAMLMALGRDADARAELRGLREKGDSVPELSWNAELINRFLVKSLMAAHDWRGAATVCRDILHTRGGDAITHALLSECERTMGNAQIAINHARRAINAEPEAPELRYGLIMALYENEDWVSLAKELETARRGGADPALLSRFFALLAHRRGGDDKAVVKLLQDAIHRSGPTTELMTALGERYIYLDLPELAETWFTRSLRLNPEDERAALGAIAAAEGLMKAGDNDAERRLNVAYDHYLEKWPDNIAIRREHALFLVDTGVLPAAAAELEALLAWDAANASLRKVLAYVYRKIGKYRAAAVLLRALLKTEPRDIRLLLEFTRCLEKLGSSAYAAAVLTKALPVVPSAAEPALALGRIEERRGRIEAALDAYREAAARAPNDPRPSRYMAALYRRHGVAETADRHEQEALRRASRPSAQKTKDNIDKLRDPTENQKDDSPSGIVDVKKPRR